MMMTMQVRPSRQDNNGIKNPIYVTTQDKQRLEDLLMEVEASDPRKHGDLKALTEESLCSEDFYSFGPWWDRKWSSLGLCSL